MVSPSSLASSRQVLAWSLPTVAIVLSILWFRKRQRRHQTDPGGTPTDATSSTVDQEVQLVQQKVEEQLQRQQFVQQLQQQLKPREVSSIPEEEEDELEDIDDPEEVRIVLEEVQKLVSESDVGVVVVDEQEQHQEHKDEISVDKAVEEAPASSEASEAMASAACADTAEPVPKQEAEPQAPAAPAEAAAAAAVTQPKKGKKTKGKKQQQQPKQEQVEQICQVMSKITVDVQPTQAQPRDSANHSPSEAMLASPSISHDSDSHSVNSNDSGKGGSDVITNEDAEKGGKTRTRTSSRRTSSCSIAGSEHNLDEVQSGGAGNDADRDDAQLQGQQAASVVPASSACCVYDFYIPLTLVGRLIGKHGCFVNQIKSETRSQIQVKNYHDEKYKIVSLTGSQVEIEKALSLIRKKFPKKKYPNFTMDQIGPEDLVQPSIPLALRMYLVESINNDVILSSLVSAGHMFVQQPTHPTFPYLSQLIMVMTDWYSQAEAPTLPYPKPSVICAAPSQGSWYRAEVIDVRTERTEEQNEEVMCDIKFVDYGGYTTIALSELRQIRQDFVILPFQAIECYLADVIWPDGDDGWSVEAFSRVEELTRDTVLQAQVVCYAENSVPYIRLYSAHIKNQSVNEVLALENYAKFCSLSY